MPHVILCRFGELFLKLGNRARFQRVLLDNVSRALAGLPGLSVGSPHGRIVVRVDESNAPTADADLMARACARLSRVFGLVSLSPAEVAALDVDAISAAAVRAAAAAAAFPPVAAAGRSRPAAAPRFKVEARRSNKRFPLPSPEIARVVGARVAESLGLDVDVHHPDLRIGIEVADDGAYVYAGALAAPGGLPAGVSGRALLLLSGGIDSPVAGWLAAKRGLVLDAVYFHSPPYVGPKSLDKVMDLARILRGWQAAESLTVVGFTEAQKRLRDAGPAELAVVLYRRMMMRIADAIADRNRAAALVTGENLGQVASQTISNLSVIEAAARRMVLRPLLTYDKVETTAHARRIGTYETSVLPFDDCCSLFVPPHPATAARLIDVERVEAQLDIAALAAAAAAAAEPVAL